MINNTLLVKTRLNGCGDINIQVSCYSLFKKCNWLTNYFRFYILQCAFGTGTALLPKARAFGKSSNRFRTQAVKM